MQDGEMILKAARWRAEGNSKIKEIQWGRCLTLPLAGWRIPENSSRVGRAGGIARLPPASLESLQVDLLSEIG